MFSFQLLALPRTTYVVLLAALLSTNGSSTPQAPPNCLPRWQPTFGGMPGTNDKIRAQVVFDDGAGPALYVAGEFTSAGGVATQRIARWNGTTWSALGNGTNGPVHSLAVFDDGSGPALYVGGEFTLAGGVSASRIAKWNGASWSALASGCNSTVYSQGMFDDGTGPALYAGGYLTLAGGVVVSGVARWNGASWSAVGSNLMGSNALAVFDDGTGPALYSAEEDLRKWNGTTWSNVGGNLNGKLSYASALATFDDGGGPALYVGGIFTTAGGMPASGLVRWNGSAWSVPGGIPTGNFYQFQSLLAFDDGTGPALFAGGYFSIGVGSGNGVQIAKWNGTTWSTLTTSVFGGGSSLFALAGFDDGGGPALFAGGSFSSISAVGTPNIARRRSSMWTPVGVGLNDRVNALQVFDAGAGPELYVGGNFRDAGGLTANGIARWNGSAWTPMGGALQAGTFTSALAVVDLGTGPALYADSFLTGGILRWNGTSWTTIGFWNDHNVRAITGYDDGSGNKLYAGGYFRGANGAVHAVVRWSGSAWSGLGSGLTGPPSPSASALVVFDDGTGPALYAGGNFTHSGALAVNGVAKWNGSAWQALGSGIGGAPGASVLTLAVYDDGAGPRLYAGGYFNAAGGVTANFIARWDGTTWSPVGGGTNDIVRELIVLDDGGGPALIASGAFTFAGGVPVNHLAKWKGSSWTPYAGGLNGVSAMTTYDDGSGPSVFVGGEFLSSPSGDSHLAQWGYPCASGTPYCFGDGSGTPCPCGNNSLTSNLEGCLHSLGTGGQLTARGEARISADTVVLTGSRMPNGSALYFQGTTHASNGAGTPFGDGLRCASGTVRRLGSKPNVAGSSHFPAAGDPNVSVRGGVATPGTRTYQVWYRNAASFCTASTFNMTNGWRTTWLP